MLALRQQRQSRACSGTCRRRPSTTRATLALARRHGERFRESVAAGNLVYLYVFAGRWEEGSQLAAELLEDMGDRPGAEFLRFPLAILHTFRGELEEARASLALMVAWERGDDDELRAIHTSVAIRPAHRRGPARGCARAAAKACSPPAIEALGSLPRRGAQRLAGHAARPR